MAALVRQATGLSAAGGSVSTPRPRRKLLEGLASERPDGRLLSSVASNALSLWRAVRDVLPRCDRVLGCLL